MLLHDGRGTGDSLAAENGAREEQFHFDRYGDDAKARLVHPGVRQVGVLGMAWGRLLYPSDAADACLGGDLRGRRSS